MDQAIDVHDHVIRTQLGKYNGYEVTTEGDAFLLALHDASDAIAWSAATQQVSTPMCASPCAPSLIAPCVPMCVPHVSAPCVCNPQGQQQMRMLLLPVGHMSEVWMAVF